MMIINCLIVMEKQLKVKKYYSKLSCVVYFSFIVMFAGIGVYTMFVP